MNSIGGGQYKTTQSREREMFLYVRIAKPGLTPLQVRTAQREYNGKKTTPEVGPVADDATKNSAALIKKSDETIDFTKTFPMEKYVEQRNYKIFQQKKTAKKGCTLIHF